MLVGTGANVVLGYLFIIVLDGGMRGAGPATVLLMGAVGSVRDAVLPQEGLTHALCAVRRAVARPAHRAARLRPRNRSVRPPTGLRRVVYDREQPVGAVRVPSMRSAWTERLR